MSIGQLIGALLDIPAHLHHLPVHAMSGETYVLPVTSAAAYDIDEQVGVNNPFIIEASEVSA